MELNLILLVNYLIYDQHFSHVTLMTTEMFWNKMVDNTNQFAGLHYILV